MTTRKQLAALLANEQVILPGPVVDKVTELAALLSDRIAQDTPDRGGFIRVGMDWSTLELGQVYALPAGKWVGQNRDYFTDASEFQSRNPAVQLEFGGDSRSGHWVKRIR